MTGGALNTDSSLREQVAEEVRALLARRRLSARRAATELGWTEWYMSRRMTAKTAFDVDDLAALAELLGVTVIDFFPARRGDGYVRLSKSVSLRDRNLPPGVVESPTTRAA